LTVYGADGPNVNIYFPGVHPLKHRSKDFVEAVVCSNKDSKQIHAAADWS
jgi:hypothetical protein